MAIECDKCKLSRASSRPPSPTAKMYVLSCGGDSGGDSGGDFDAGELGVALAHGILHSLCRHEYLYGCNTPQTSCTFLHGPRRGAVIPSRRFAHCTISRQSSPSFGPHIRDLAPLTKHIDNDVLIPILEACTRGASLR
jgi:hypothetical protein